MKNQIYKLFFGKNAYVSLLAVFAIVLFVGLGCSGSKKDGKPVPAEYQGAWTGSDGSTLTIRSDSSGDYHSGGTKVDNGTVAIDDAAKTLSITFFGIGPTLKIDQAPSGNSMKLEGTVYKKSGSTDTTKLADKKDKPSYEKSDASKGEMPSDEELQDIVKTTLMDFAEAVKDEDFSDFYDNISKPWKKETSAEALKTTFQGFIDRKIDISDIDPLEATFSTDPVIEKDLGYKTLKLDGKYPTTPNSTKFNLHYIPEGKVWKLSSIRVNTKPD
jgi:hypothetical protein